MLKSKGNIPPHIDQYTKVVKGIRYRVFHYGIITPDNCRLIVNEKFRTIKEGEILEFDPYKTHSEENNSDHIQVVLYIKVLDVV